MLSARNEMIAVGLLIAYLAFVPGLDVVRQMLATSVGKAAALAGIVYVHKKLSCSVALLLVVAYLRCTLGSGWEGFTTPTATVSPTCTCPDGYAYDSISKECKPTSSMSGSVPVESESSSSTAGASISTPPPNSAVSTAPMTTPMPTMPPVGPSASGGVQPSTGSSSSVAPV